MIFKPTTDIKDELRKASLLKPISDEDMSIFKSDLSDFMSFCKEDNVEQTLAGYLKTLLESSFYKKDHLIVLEENRKDMAIKSEYSSEAPNYVFIETKRIKSKDMVKVDDLNAKAFYETIYYYMRERAKGNDELKQIVITNMYEWCIINALEYDRLFWRDTSFKKLYDDFVKNRLGYNDTEQLYKKGLPKAVEHSNGTIHYLYFNLKEECFTSSDNAKKKLDYIYKILSPKFMFKQFEIQAQPLQKDFYAELLYIMGLEEVKDNGKKYIRRSRERNEGSLIENAIEQIKTGDITYLNVEGDTLDERLFNAALQLAIIWINRVLFLKLLESQLCSYHKGNEEKYRFLNVEKIKNYSDLDKLFFNVLALPEEERSTSIKEKYPNVPYLNSSLFEIDRLEKNATRIQGLSNDAELPLWNKSNLKKYENFKKTKISSLEYLLKFLDSFDFGSDKNEEDTQRHLISPSVLGLIFEKINGYKDGAIFTPPEITMFMCRQTLRKAVVDKFNEAYPDWGCSDLTDLYNHITNKKDANEIFNSIHICDPAVGSGHFLVSALNELIAIKAELGIIIDKDGRTLRDYNIEVIHDDLLITDDEGNKVYYTPSLNYRDSQRLQEVIFTEKRTIIENCLFGVDINPNSVNICKLRLWIELLKNTYYDRENGKLQTLPNIDINITTGNSLVFKFPINLGKTIGIKSNQAKKLKANIKRLKSLIADYKQNSNKEQRNQIKGRIKEISKSYLSDGELNLFGDNEIVNFKNPFHDAMEWMIRFPDVLDEEANFVGFDVIIGNPPYINMEDLGGMSDFYKNLPGKAFTRKTYKTYDSSGDILTLFLELGRLLVKEGGLVSYIISNSWMRTKYGKSTRKFLSEHTNPILLIDFTKFSVFKDITVETCILTFERGQNQLRTRAANVTKDDYANFETFLEDSLIPCEFNTSEFWYVLQPKEQVIRNHVKKVGKKLSNKIWKIESNFGIKTGCNEAFLIDSKTYKVILSHCKNEKERGFTKELIQKVVRGQDVGRYVCNWDDLYLIATFPSKKHEILIYPAVSDYLETFAADILREKGYEWIANDDKLLREFCRKKLYQTGGTIKIDGQNVMIGKNGTACKARKRTSHNWFELQDNIAFWKSFAKPKLIWKRIGDDVRYSYDESGLLTLDSTCFAVGKHLKYICGILNSKMGRYLMKFAPKTGTGDSLVSKQAFLPLYVPYPSAADEKELSDLVDKMRANPEDTETQSKIDRKVFQLYKIVDYDLIQQIETSVESKQKPVKTKGSKANNESDPHAKRADSNTDDSEIELLDEAGNSEQLSVPELAQVIKPARKTGNVNITVNINKFEKPVGAVIQTGESQEIKEIVDIKTE